MFYFFYIAELMNNFIYKKNTKKTTLTSLTKKNLSRTPPPPPNSCSFSIPPPPQNNIRAAVRRVTQRPFSRNVRREIAETEVKVREKGQLFDITASAVLPALQDPEEFSCEVRIPEANYTKRQETVFFPGELSRRILFFISGDIPRG